MSALSPPDLQPRISFPLLDPCPLFMSGGMILDNADEADGMDDALHIVGSRMVGFPFQVFALFTACDREQQPIR